jgi:hypothetical protein
MSEIMPADWQDADVETFQGGSNVRDKKELLGRPFMIGRATFRTGDYGPYVSLTCVDPANEEFVLNDGSSGIYKQMVDYLHAKGRLDSSITRPDSQEYDLRLLVRRGVRVSEYETDSGKPARTYYLS